MDEKERDIEIRLVIRTTMSDEELEEFLDELEIECKETLLSEDYVLSSLQTDKISYESKQLLKELGVE